MDSAGAVIALLTFDGLLPFVLEDTGDKGGERVEVAMMTCLDICPRLFHVTGNNILALQVGHLTARDHWGRCVVRPVVGGFHNFSGPNRIVHLHCETKYVHVELHFREMKRMAFGFDSRRESASLRDSHYEV
jgi:hypothetical protein